MTYILPYVLLILLLLSCLVVAQITGTIDVGQSLTAGDSKASPWLSSNQDFAFGFYKIENEDFFFLAIWYNKIPDENIVWYPKEVKPAPRGSKVELTADRGFVLDDPKAAVEMWKSGISVGVAASGFLNDTGNLVIQNSNSENLWESFNNPADTMLPAQVFTKEGPFLSSRRSETNFSLGKCQLRLLQDGNLVISTINLPTKFKYDAYYVSNTADSNVSNAGYKVVFDESGSLYILRANNARFSLSTAANLPATEYYLRATLNYDGVFTLSYFPKNSTRNGNWSVLSAIPKNICTGIAGAIDTGPCGCNSVCTLSVEQRPTCRCPPKFSLLDQNDQYGGCKPDFPISCQEDGLKNPEEVYDFEVLTNTGWPESDYEKLMPMNVEECKRSCLHDCLCTVAVFRGDSCWKKKLPLSNGIEEVGDLGRLRAFIKVRKNITPQNSGHPVPGAKKDQDTFIIEISVLLGSSAFVNLVFMVVICLGVFFLYNNKLTRVYRG